MKSLKFQKLNLPKEDLLSREQLKKVLGGAGYPECSCDTRCELGPLPNGDMAYADCGHVTTPTGPDPDYCLCGS